MANSIGDISILLHTSNHDQSSTEKKPVQRDHVIPRYTGQVGDEHSEIVVFELVDNRLVSEERQYSTTAFISSTFTNTTTTTTPRHTTIKTPVQLWYVEDGGH